MSKERTLLPQAILLIQQSGAINLLTAQATNGGNWRLKDVVWWEIINSLIRLSDAYMRSVHGQRIHLTKGQ